MGEVTTLADASDMPLMPVWVWALLGVVVVTAITVVYVAKIAAPAQESPATAPVPATTNPECVRQSHPMAKVGGGVVWICLRDGCDETWLVMPERDPFDQEAAEVVAAAESLLRGAAS